MAAKLAAQLPIPSFFDPANADNFAYNPDVGMYQAVNDWTRQHHITAAANQHLKIALLLIDMQRDFTNRKGALYVGGRSGNGAVDDSVRVAQFIYRNLANLTSIDATLDTHLGFQIFFPSFWIDADGNHPAPFQFLLTQDILDGKFDINPLIAPILTGGKGNLGWLRKQAIHYTRELEKAGKYQLYLWPTHCIAASLGYCMTGVIQEAIEFAALARGFQFHREKKGDNPFTENYSVLSPEVTTRHDGQALPNAAWNDKFFARLMKNDYVLIAGQAGSHCVKSSIDDLLDRILAVDPALAKKVVILGDCMSAVTVPDGSGGFLADFTPQQEQALDRYRNAGMLVVNSTDPIDSWLQAA